MSDLFLTMTQLQELTGLSQSAAQVRWLQKNGIRHYVRADGRPSVTVAAIEGREGQAMQRARPNFAALHKAS